MLTTSHAALARQVTPVGPPSQIFQVNTTSSATVTRTQSDGLSVTLVFSVDQRPEGSFIVVDGTEVDANSNTTLTFSFDLSEYTGPLYLADDGEQLSWIVPNNTSEATTNPSLALDTYVVQHHDEVDNRTWEIEIPIPFSDCYIRIGGWGEDDDLPACFMIGYVCPDPNGGPPTGCLIVICADGWIDCFGGCSNWAICNPVQQ